MLLILFLKKYFSQQKSGTFPMVDPKFVALLKSSVARLVGQGILKPCMMSLKFWSKWKKKFADSRRYRKKRSGEGAHTKPREKEQKRKSNLNENKSPQPSTSATKRLVNIAHFNKSLLNRGIDYKVRKIEG